MKINQLIRALEEAREIAGADVEIVVGDVSGQFHDRIDVNVLGGSWVSDKLDDSQKVAVVQAYVAKGRLE